jgi:hypothetical protein
MLFETLGLVLLALVLTGPLDHQIVVSIVRALLFLGIFYNLCGLMCYLNMPLLHGCFGLLLGIVGVIKLPFTGLARYYIKERWLGDLLLEMIPVILFAVGVCIAFKRTMSH